MGDNSNAPRDYWAFDSDYIDLNSGEDQYGLSAVQLKSLNSLLKMGDELNLLIHKLVNFAHSTLPGVHFTPEPGDVVLHLNNESRERPGSCYLESADIPGTEPDLMVKLRDDVLHDNEMRQAAALHDLCSRNDNLRSTLTALLTTVQFRSGIKKCAIDDLLTASESKDRFS